MPVSQKKFRLFGGTRLRNSRGLVPALNVSPYDKADPWEVVFKYYLLWQYAQMSWKEMNLWMRLPRHPNIVPFDQVVVDELEGRVVGFTSNYVPGGDLGENKSRVFKLKWLQQLIKVVDDLNLNSIMLFDFNFATRINCPSPGEGESYIEDRNDFKGVIFTTYEIITQDDSLRSIPHQDQNLDNLGLKWVKHPEVKLDHPVESYQLMLKEWRERREGGFRSGNVPRPIECPAMPKPPQKDHFFKNCTRADELRHSGQLV
ncbi:hypothetical protein LZL87_004650 [Fusarium oxysporum]|nr:hypothetical protein LZL87_004650 [Fusarium oxysporum]